MRSEWQFLDVQDPDINQYTIKLELQKFSIGRSNGNDIVLPNPEKTISRQHCFLEYVVNLWWVVDESSANGTFVQRYNTNTTIDVRQHNRLHLNNGDTILILGRLLEVEEPVFWKLTFRDNDETGRYLQFQPPAYLEYSLSQQKLFLVNTGKREEILLTKKERNLINYMAQCNQANDHKSVVCEYHELIQAIWGESFGHTSNDVTRLVWAIRSKVECDSGEPEFLKTEKGRGYSLQVKLMT
ncbi:MAG: FHA domain-containing protein [Nostoc sp. ChiSLP02]|nr:FHA domain-containing protein [Nostoc sp. DedSLP01]MDZ8188462.1 FHA domain-containing protein [Nostoc sp. ChiSLP02]